MKGGGSICCVLTLATEYIIPYSPGNVVMTRYNNKTYRVDDIQWDSNPQSTFTDRRGGEVRSFTDRRGAAGGRGGKIFY